MATLSRRLETMHKAANDQAPADTALQGFRSMSLDDMWQCPLGFGRTYPKKTYGDVWLNHQDYVQWFLDHHSTSTTMGHRKFLFFCQCMIERAELEGVAVPCTTNGAIPVPASAVTGGVVVVSVEEECEDSKLSPAMVQGILKRLEELEVRVAALQSILKDDAMIVMQ